MKSFTEESNVGTMIRAGRRTIAMGKGHPKAKALVEAFEPTQKALKAVNQAAIEADDARIDAEAAIELQKALLIDELDDMQLVLEQVVKKDYKDPLYGAFFPEGFSEYKAQSPEKLADGLPMFIETLKKSGDKRLSDLVPAFEAKAKSFEKPLANFKHARTAAHTADLMLGRAVEAWLDGYAALEGSFHAAFPRRRKFVAAFFPTSATPSKKKDAEAEKKTSEKKTDEKKAEAGSGPAKPGPVAAGKADGTAAGADAAAVTPGAAGGAATTAPATNAPPK